MTDEEKIVVREHERKRPNRRGDHQKLAEAKADRSQGGVQILGGGPSGGVSVESKSLGGSIETTVEIGLDQNDRDTDGRRLFRS